MADRYHVRISDRALSSLQSHFDYIRQHSPQNAATMIGRIVDAIEGLETMPDRFRVVGRSRKRGTAIHAWVVRPYIVYYRIDESPRGVAILDVRHGAQRQPRRFE